MTTPGMSHRWQFYPIVHIIMMLMHMALSLVFITAPAQRFSSPSWQPLLDMSGGNILPWGITLGVAGILMALRGLWTDIIGEFIAVCWFSFLSALFAVALQDPNASATGCVVYAGLMAVNGALLSQRVLDWTKKRNDSRR